MKGQLKNFLIREIVFFSLIRNIHYLLSLLLEFINIYKIYIYIKKSIYSNKKSHKN